MSGQFVGLALVASRLPRRRLGEGGSRGEDDIRDGCRPAVAALWRGKQAAALQGMHPFICVPTQSAKRLLVGLRNDRPGTSTE